MALLANLMDTSYRTPTPESQEAERTKRLSRNRAGVSTNSSSQTHSQEVNSSGQANTRYKTRWSWQERYDYAISQGLSPDNAKTYASLQYSFTSDTFLSRLRGALGGKSDSEAFLESNEQADSNALNQLLESQRQQDYTDPASEVERRQAAGLNDALTGGSEIGTGDSAPIDDEAIGSGISSSLDALHADQTTKSFFDVCSSMMNGATSIMGLVSSGVGIAASIQSMDDQALTSLFSIGSMLEGMSDNPLGLNIDNYTIYDADGNPKLDTEALKRDVIPLRSRRFAPILKRLNDYYSPRMRANQTAAAADTASDKSRWLDARDSLAKRGLFTDQMDSISSSWLNETWASETYQQYINNVAEMFSSGITAENELNKFTINYNRALNAGKKAEAENILNEYNTFSNKLRMSAAQQVNANIQDLIKKSQNGDWVASLLLQSVISGSFNEYGLGNPYDIPKYMYDKGTDFGGQLFNLVPKKSVSTIIKK